MTLGKFMLFVHYLPIVLNSWVLLQWLCIMNRVYGMCPTPIAVGPKNTGKSTAARTGLALFGTPQFFICHFTAAAPSMLGSTKLSSMTLVTLQR
jgi:hypothetical protein